MTVSASGSGRRPRREVPALGLTDDEKAEIDAILADKTSVRARQRVLALWLGKRRKKIDQEWLRDLAVEHEAYNVANFAQNMKKDGIYFVELKDEKQSRIDWRLSRTGSAEAKVLDELAQLPPQQA